jgi:hypothetical protein
MAVARLPLGPSAIGAHVLRADKPFGAQIAGYTAQTSYAYPAGAALARISPAPAE